MDSDNKTLLIATLADLSTPYTLAPVIATAAKSTRQRLTIVLLSPFFESRPLSDHDANSNSNTAPFSRTEHWNDVQRLLSYVYVQATLVSHDLGNVLMEVDVLLRGNDRESSSMGEDLGVGVDVCVLVEGDHIAIPLPLSITRLRKVVLPRGASPSTHEAQSANSPPLHPMPTPPLFPVSILGGTFDHLHAGHKVLLSMAAWITSEKLIVGMTDDALLKSKSFKDVLEPLPQRSDNVRAFLTLFRPDLVYDIVPIIDVYGPTRWDPNIQALVVSKETLSGADSIATHRKAHGLPALQTFVIDVISSTSSDLGIEDAELLKRTKMSSTAIREWIMQSRIP